MITEADKLEFNFLYTFEKLNNKSIIKYINLLNNFIGRYANTYQSFTQYKLFFKSCGIEEYSKIDSYSIIPMPVIAIMNGFDLVETLFSSNKLALKDDFFISRDAIRNYIEKYFLMLTLLEDFNSNFLHYVKLHARYTEVIEENFIISIDTIEKNYVSILCINDVKIEGTDAIFIFSGKCYTYRLYTANNSEKELYSISQYTVSQRVYRDKIISSGVYEKWFLKYRPELII